MSDAASRYWSPGGVVTAAFQAITFALIAAFAIVWLANAWFFFSYPFERDIGEGIVLNDAWDLAHGRPIYTPVGPEGGWRVTTYPGFYELLVSAGLRASGPTFFWGRALSASATLVVMGSIFAIIRRRTDSPQLATLGALVPVTFHVVGVWGQCHRVDMTALALALAGFAVADRSIEGRAAAFYASVPLFVAALFTRQSCIAAPAAIAVAALVRNRRRGIWFVVATAVVGLSIFAALEVATGGWYYYHVVRYAGAGGSFEAVKHFTKHVAAEYPILSVLAGLWLVATAVRRRLDPFALYWLGALVLSLAERSGKNSNYWLEILVLTGAGAALGMAELRRVRFVGVRWSPVAWAAVVVQIALTYAGVMNPEGLVRRELPSFADNADRWRILRELARASGPVIARDESLALYAGKTVPYTPFIMAHLAEEGLVDDGPFVEATADGTFSHIYLQNAFDERTRRGFLYTEGFYDAVSDNYRLALRLARGHETRPPDAEMPDVPVREVYVPKAPKPAQPPAPPSAEPSSAPAPSPPGEG
jgi:hypothetical protein